MARDSYPKNLKMMKTLSANIEKPIRVFLPENFVISDWNSIASFFEDLAERPLKTVIDLEKWLIDMSELEAVISEDVSWRIAWLRAIDHPGLERGPDDGDGEGHCQTG